MALSRRPWRITEGELTRRLWRSDQSPYRGFLHSCKMMYAGRVILAVAMVVVSVAALPNHLKAIVVDRDPVPVVVVKEPAVSASFGGYSAKAGVGGPGGVYAGADSPLGSAGVGADTGPPAVTVGSSPPAHKPPVHQGPGLFDGIFNIPISVLQAVNTYLNNRGPVAKPMVYRRRGHHPVVVEKTVTPESQGVVHSETPAADASASASSSASASASSSASSSSSAESGQGGHQPGQGAVVLTKRVNYDDIFNIPISALKSVNQLLNG